MSNSIAGIAFCKELKTSLNNNGVLVSFLPFETEIDFAMRVVSSVMSRYFSYTSFLAILMTVS